MATTQAIHRAWTIEAVFVFLDDIRILHQDHDANHRCHGKEIDPALITAINRLTIVIFPAVVSANPERGAWNLMTIIERDDILIHIARLLKLDSEEFTGLGQAKTRINETEQRENRIVLEK